MTVVYTRNYPGEVSARIRVVSSSRSGLRHHRKASSMSSTIWGYTLGFYARRRNELTDEFQILRQPLFRFGCDILCGYGILVKTA
jgi:hypothetical protein